MSETSLQIKRIENSFFGSNTYVLTINGCNECLIVDCGDSDKIIDFCENTGVRVSGILLTHGHYDHIYGLNDIVEHYSGVKIFGVQEVFSEISNPKLNYSFYHGVPYTYSGDKDRFIKLDDNQIVDTPFEKISLKTLYTPGHDNSCMSYVIGNYIFTGDSLIPGVPTVTILRGDKIKSAESRDKLLKIVEEKGLTICPGHGEMVTANLIIENL